MPMWGRDLGEHGAHRNVCTSVSFVDTWHPRGEFGIIVASPAEFLALRFCAFEAGAAALANHCSLEFGKHAHHLK